MLQLVIDSEIVPIARRGQWRGEGEEVFNELL